MKVLKGINRKSRLFILLSLMFIGLSLQSQEICNNNIDDDGDGWIDCNDNECFTICGNVEICDNGIDDDGNGLIDRDDPQCNASSGVDGGLESNRRLSNAISLRKYKTLKSSSIDRLEKLEGILPFNGNQITNRNNIHVSSLMPHNMDAYYLAESSPLDLVDITNATEVQAVDLYKDHHRTGAILAMKSEGTVYEHSKYICDRMEGNRLLDVSEVEVLGNRLVTYQLMKKNRQMEYGISFSCMEYNGQMEIFSNWNVSEYPESETIYNFQVWSYNKVDLVKITEGLVEELYEALNVVSSNRRPVLPQVFVMHSDYTNGILSLVIKNKNNSSRLEYSGSYRTKENAEFVEMGGIASLDGSLEQAIEISTERMYDLDLYIRGEYSYADAIFVSEGAWGVDDNTSISTVNSFETQEDLREKVDTAYHVERSMEIHSQIKNSMNIYRVLRVKNKSMDLSSFNCMNFVASGNGSVEITIVKESISHWSDQFRTTIKLTDDKKEFPLFLETFKSQYFDTLDLDDAVMIVFTQLGDKVEVKDYAFALEDLEFVNKQVPNQLQALSDEGLVVKMFPNFVKDNTTINILTTNGQDINLVMYNAMGARVMKEKYNCIPGSNNISVNLSNLNQGAYFFVCIDDEGRHYNGQFLKIE